MSGNREKMHTGELYQPGDPEILSWQMQRLDRLYDYNMTRPTEGEKREALLREMLAEVGEGCYIEPPFHTNLGGAHVHFGKYVYANFNLTCVDDTQSCRSCGRRACSSTCPSALGATAGWGPASSCCPA